MMPAPYTLLRGAMFVVAGVGSLLAAGNTCTTISDGPWSDPTVWDCGCEPTACDSLVIGHALTHAGDLLVDAVHVRILPAGELVVQGELLLEARLHCAGVVEAEYFRMPGLLDTLECAGSIQAAEVRIANTWSHNTGQIMASDSLQLEENNNFENWGDLSCGFAFMQGVFYNHGSFSVDRGVRSLAMVNSGEIRCGGSFAVTSIYYNEPEALLQADSIFLFSMANHLRSTVIADSAFYIGNQWISTAQVTVHDDALVICRKDLHNFGALTGDGSICVARHSANHGTISGVDLCDATPPSTGPAMVDVNNGTIANSVSYCATLACDGLGVQVADAAPAWSLWPNPSPGMAQLQGPADAGRVQLLVHDAAGREVLRAEHVAGAGPITLRTEGWSRGAYAVRVVSERAAQVLRLVVE